MKNETKTLKNTVCRWRWMARAPLLWALFPPLWEYSWDFWIQACLGMGGVETVSLDKENGLWESRREVLPSVWWVLKPDLRGVGVQMQMAGKVGILVQSGCTLKCIYVFHREIWDHIQKNPSFGSVMPLLGIYLAKRIKYVCICLALWKIIVILLTKAKHFS